VVLESLVSETIEESIFRCRVVGVWLLCGRARREKEKNETNTKTQKKDGVVMASCELVLFMAFVGGHVGLGGHCPNGCYKSFHQNKFRSKFLGETTVETKNDWEDAFDSK
jgi:hypothetical protein